MPRRINDQALEDVAKALGLSGVGIPGVTELRDSVVHQVLDIVPLARRGRTLAGTTGFYRGVLQNIHSGSGTLSSNWAPYDPLAAGILPPYTSPVARGFDVWLYGGGIRRSSGTGTNSAALFLISTGQQFGIDDGGSAITASLGMPLGFWDRIQTSGTVTMMTDGQDWPWRTWNMRLPRLGGLSGGVTTPTIVFQTDVSAASTWEFYFTFGVFPSALGQDISV